VIGPDVEPAPRQDRLKVLVDVLAVGLGVLAVALAAAEWAWRQVQP
jgi:hypothetical protein